MQVTSFAWLNAKIEKISTKEKFENYGFFSQYYTLYTWDDIMNKASADPEIFQKRGRTFKKQTKNRCVCKKNFVPARNKAPKIIFSAKVTVQVTRSGGFDSKERASLVEY